MVHESKYFQMEVLKDWGFSDKDIEILKQNDITFDLLQDMTDEDFNFDIGLTLGKKIRLQKCLKQYKKGDAMGVKNMVEFSSPSTSYNHEKGLQCLIVNELPMNQTNYVDKPAHAKRPTDSLLNNVVTTPQKIPRVENFEYTFPSTSEEFEVPILYLNDKTLSPHVVRNILLETLEGQALFKSYERKEYFSDCEKGTLVHCLINRCELNSICRPPLFLNKLADVIVYLFPAESKDSYYIPALTGGNLTKNAKGKLSDKWRNMLSKLRTCGLLYKKNQSRCISEEINQSETIYRFSLPYVTNDELLSHIQWLEEHREPWNDVITHWDVTYEYRKNMYNSLKNADEILEKWPILKSHLAPHLVILDFEKLYPDKKLCIEENWEQLFENVYILRKEYVRKTDAVEYLKIYDENQNGNFDLDGLRLIILPFLLIGKGRVGKIGKPSTSETHEGFIIWCKTQNEIASAVESRTNRYKSMKLSTPPCIILVANNPLIIEESYVSIDTHLWKTDMPLQALDVLFKLFFVFGLQYPADCLTVWLLIQQQLYDIHLPKLDKKIPLLTTITSQLKVLRK